MTLTMATCLCAMPSICDAQLKVTTAGDVAVIISPSRIVVLQAMTTPFDMSCAFQSAIDGPVPSKYAAVVL